MSEPIRFEDGAAYEKFMGRWSQMVGTQFLDWLAPRSGLDWVDVGCGNGAFTTLILERCAPTSVLGVDPSEAQLKYARERFAAHPVRFEQGGAMSLSLANDSVDVAVMPLVISFVPEPAVGVSEMARVVRPGGQVAAYMWDMDGGGFPYALLHERIRSRGFDVPLPPVPAASRLEVMEGLWQDAGLRDIDVATIRVSRTWESFDDFWQTVQSGPSAGQSLRQMDASVLTGLRDEVQGVLATDETGQVMVDGWANAVRGRV